MRRAAALGDDICKRLAQLHPNQKLYTQSHTNARGDDDDSRQIIADLISSDDSPFTPDDDMALRQMSRASLKEMRRMYLKRNSASPSAVANFEGRDFSFGSGVAGADFARRQAELRARSIAYCNANPVQRRDAVTVNSNDPSYAAMHGESSVDALRRKGGK